MMTLNKTISLFMANLSLSAYAITVS
jgi:hypothetical protein